MEKEQKFSNYLEKLLKLIPSEIVLVYATLITFIPNELRVHLIISLLLLIAVPIYLTQSIGIKNKKQIYVSTSAFLVWVFYLGGPFTFFEWYEKWMAGTALILFSLIPPILFRKPTNYEEYLQVDVEKKLNIIETNVNKYEKVDADRGSEFDSEDTVVKEDTDTNKDRDKRLEMLLSMDTHSASLSKDHKKSWREI